MVGDRLGGDSPPPRTERDLMDVPRVERSEEEVTGAVLAETARGTERESGRRDGRRVETFGLDRMLAVPVGVPRRARRMPARRMRSPAIVSPPPDQVQLVVALGAVLGLPHQAGDRVEVEPVGVPD